MTGGLTNDPHVFAPPFLFFEGALELVGRDHLVGEEDGAKVDLAVVGALGLDLEGLGELFGGE